LVPARSIAPGDIVSFRLPTAEMSTTHRVIKIAEKDGSLVLTTKGDANQSADPEPVLIQAGGSIQRVERVVPYAGYVVHTARGPAGAVVLFGIPIIGLTFDRRKRGSTPRAERPDVLAAPTMTIATASTLTTTFTGLGPVDSEAVAFNSRRRSNFGRSIG